MQLTLITGAARSGKSSFAQKLAAQKACSPKFGGVVYLATAIVGDAEMQRRVKLHQQSRPRQWKTIEEPYELVAAINKIPKAHLLLLDCLTVWITNLLCLKFESEKETWPNMEHGWKTTFPSAGRVNLQKKEAELEKYILQKTAHFLAALKQNTLTSILVTNEVGWGIVPEHYLGRLFRDLAGKVNQQVAAEAAAVYLVTAGIPLKIK